jgi:hypothetical protein
MTVGLLSPDSPDCESELPVKLKRSSGTSRNNLLIGFLVINDFLGLVIEERGRQAIPQTTEIISISQQTFSIQNEQLQREWRAHWASNTNCSWRDKSNRPFYEFLPEKGWNLATLDRQAGGVTSMML